MGRGDSLLGEKAEEVDQGEIIEDPVDHPRNLDCADYFSNSLGGLLSANPVLGSGGT